MEKEIKVFWGKQHDPNDIHELTLTINKEPDSKYYSVSRAILEHEGSVAARNMGLPSGVWDLNNINDFIEDNDHIFREGEMIYIHEGLDEKKSVAQVEFYPFGNTRLEYFIPASNNNDSSDDDVIPDGFVVGGGKRKRSRHSFVGKKVLPLPPPSQQSEFYKKTKANIEKVTEDFLAEEKIRQNASLTYTPSEENFILEATKIKKGGGKYNNLYEVNSHVKVYWRNIDGTYSPHIAKITAINGNEITFAFKNPTYIWRGDPETATDGKGNKLIEKIQRKFPRIPKKRGYGGKSPKKRTKKRKRKRKRKTRRKRKTKKRKSAKRTRRRRRR